MGGRPVSPNNNAHGERLIVDAAKAGNEQALSELYTLYFPRVYRYILARTGNTYDSEDLTEEVFMRVLEAIQRFEWREAPFSAWLFRIAHNAVISQRRKDGARGRSAPLSEGLALDSQGPDEMVETQLTILEVRRAAEKLPEAQRQVIDLIRRLRESTKSSPKRKLDQRWAGALKRYREVYTSLSLQQKALEWRGD